MQRMHGSSAGCLCGLWASDPTPHSPFARAPRCRPAYLRPVSVPIYFTRTGSCKGRAPRPSRASGGTTGTHGTVKGSKDCTCAHLSVCTCLHLWPACAPVHQWASVACASLFQNTCMCSRDGTAAKIRPTMGPSGFWVPAHAHAQDYNRPTRNRLYEARPGGAAFIAHNNRQCARHKQSHWTPVNSRPAGAAASCCGSSVIEVCPSSRRQLRCLGSRRRCFGTALPVAHCGQWASDPMTHSQHVPNLACPYERTAKQYPSRPIPQFPRISISRSLCMDGCS